MSSKQPEHNAALINCTGSDTAFPMRATSRIYNGIHVVKSDRELTQLEYYDVCKLCYNIRDVAITARNNDPLVSKGVMDVGVMKDLTQHYVG